MAMPRALHVAATLVGALALAACGPAVLDEPPPGDDMHFDLPVLDSQAWVERYLPEREWEELYDLVADPDELTDLITSRAEVAERLRAALEQRLAASAEGSAAAAELTEADRDRLRALGYLH